MNCRICGQRIVLVPSAAERAAKDVCNNPASHYTNLFREHANCALRKRAEDTLALMRRLRSPT